MKKTTKKERKKVVKSKEESRNQKPQTKGAAVSYQAMCEQIATRQANMMTQRITKDLTTSKLQEAIILSEVLGKPVSKRKDRRSLGRR